MYADFRLIREHTTNLAFAALVSSQNSKDKLPAADSSAPASSNVVESFAELSKSPPLYLILYTAWLTLMLYLVPTIEFESLTLTVFSAVSHMLGFRSFSEDVFNSLFVRCAVCEYVVLAGWPSTRSGHKCGILRPEVVYPPNKNEIKCGDFMDGWSTDQFHLAFTRCGFCDTFYGRYSYEEHRYSCYRPKILIEHSTYS